jgi:glucose-6-phosphate isomerase
VANDFRYESARSALQALLDAHAIGRIWRRDVSVWSASADPAAAASIANRLGWLDVPTGMQAELGAVEALADEVRRDGIEIVYLLGMGGSSLCAEVMRSVYGARSGYPSLVVMDTTDESAITGALARLEPKKTLFLVSSKSGGTIEPASMEKLFWSRVAAATGEPDAGRQFVAVTDPGTGLAQLAQQRGYRRVFLNPPDIGGRFSALSLFGLVPGALIGAPVREMLSAGAEMAAGCQQDNHANPGLELGAFFGAAAAHGRDKLTVVLPSALHALGLWIEQLVAESTGKHDKGALPVVDEPLASPAEYGNDRCFVSFETDHEPADLARLKALEDAGHPVLRLSTRVGALGAEFFRWEFATAIAGAVLGINPFDEPNVAEAKDKTKAILAKKDFTGGTPVAASGGVSVFSSRFKGATPKDVVRAAVDSLGPGDYVGFLSYLSADPRLESAVAEIRESIREAKHVASTFGVGPRYLHSTGQYHKGGPNKMLAFVITGEDATSTAIPGAPYTFAELKRAQAVGDFQTLEAHQRRTVRIHFDRGVDPIAGLRALFA